MEMIQKANARQQFIMANRGNYWESPTGAGG